MNYGPDAGAIVVLLNAGASAININILSEGQSLFTRDVPWVATYTGRFGD